MIFGECPHCKDLVNAPIADKQLPVYSKELCVNCGKEYWLKHSRINPEAYKEMPEGLTKEI